MARIPESPASPGHAATRDAVGGLAFEEREPHERGFAAHFDEHIKPKLQELETARLRTLAAYRKRIQKRILIAVVLWIAVVGGGIIVLQQLAVGLFGWFFFVIAGVIAGLIAGVLFGGWASKLIGQYVADRKQALIPGVLKFVGDFTYDHDGGIGEDTLQLRRRSLKGPFSMWRSIRHHS